MSPREEDLETRVEKLLSMVMELALGNFTVRAEVSEQGDSLDALTLGINMLAEEMAKHTEELVREKERTIAAQKSTIQELSTPILRVWDDILVMPLIGVVDTVRAQKMNENLLETIAATHAKVAIIDVTGVPVVDTSVAGHLLRTISASQMLGTDMILTGISPANAQTLVSLGVDLTKVETRGSLVAGLKWAMKRTEAGN